jgi:hypothetical protein
MKLIWVTLFSLFFLQHEPPYKSNEEFELKLDLQFKQRPRVDPNTIELEKRTLPTSGMNAPYLYINLRVLKASPDEVRVKVIRNKSETLLSRKFDPQVMVKLDLGFTDDIKDGISAHHYIVTFLSKDKHPLSKIEILFESDGTYLVNGEKRGKI